MTKRYHAEVPDFLRPSTVRANSKELKFDKLDSGYTVATAGSDTVGRGETLQAAHLSEVGLWPKGKAKDIMNGLLQAIPRSEEHTSELPVTNAHLVCRLLLEKTNNKKNKR